MSTGRWIVVGFLRCQKPANQKVMAEMPLYVDSNFGHGGRYCFTSFFSGVIMKNKLLFLWFISLTMSKNGS